MFHIHPFVLIEFDILKLRFTCSNLPRLYLFKYIYRCMLSDLGLQSKRNMVKSWKVGVNETGVKGLKEAEWISEQWFCCAFVLLTRMLNTSPRFQISSWRKASGDMIHQLSAFLNTYLARQFFTKYLMHTVRSNLVCSFHCRVYWARR